MALNCDQPPPSKRVKLAGMSMCKESSASVAPAQDSNGQSQQQNGGSARNGVHTENNENVDTNLYSRQIYAIGESAMFKLRRANVLISGLGGVGVEVAKNLVLGGVRHVTLHDTRNVTWHDLSSQYYLTEASIGKNRAPRVLQQVGRIERQC
ncbi:ThiF family protein [Aphelenchoides bicaudatus]|nr:ThiF family protein [Aphelenchoides bicaudatus]